MLTRGRTSEPESLAELSRVRVYLNEGFPELIGFMREDDRLVLDIGCGAGGNAALLKRQGKTVHAVTLSKSEADLVAECVDQVIVGNIEEMSFNYQDGFFDAILASHVLEHLVDPWQTLGQLRRILRPGGHLYVALPNIVFYKERMKILLGQFRYEDNGTIDRLHLRFFTFKTARELVENAGYRVIQAKTIGSVPLWPLRRLVGSYTWLDRVGCALFPNLFGGHIIVVGEKAGT